jgi:hypothetical protein
MNLPIFLPMMKCWALKFSYVQGGVTEPLVCTNFVCRIFVLVNPSLKISVSTACHIPLSFGFTIASVDLAIFLSMMKLGTHVQGG